MSKDFHKDFKFRKIKKPSKFIAFIIRIYLKLVCKKRNVEFKYGEDVKKLRKQPVIYLAQHTSKDDYFYVLSGLKRSDVHVICGYQNVFQKGVYFLLKKLGVIAKYLYQPDFTAVKQMLEAVKLGDGLVIFPEGIQSTSGSTHPINPATVNFIIKLKLPVVLVSLNGSYFTRTRYSTDIKKGKITVTFSKLFSSEELGSLSREEINEKLIKNFSYNEYEYNRQHKIAFTGEKSNIYGLDNIIYKCPHCSSEFDMEVFDDNMKCRTCGFEISMDKYYQITAVNKELLFADIDKWYKWQRREVRKLVKSDDFIMQSTVEYNVINTQKLDNDYSLKQVGKGLLTLTNKGLIYKGSKDGEEVELFFEPQKVFSLTMSLMYDLDLYYDNEYYNFKLLDNPKQCVKWMICAEEIHNLYDSIWEKASKEVYEYED